MLLLDVALSTIVLGTAIVIYWAGFRAGRFFERLRQIEVNMGIDP